MELSKRMLAVAQMVSPGGVACDVGCDHGYVPIYLIQQKICKKVIAMDVGMGPLSRAQEHIRDCGLEAYIETRLSDGVEALLPGEAQSVMIAGMGGRLVRKILSEGGEKIEALRELILQPQSELTQVRIFLRREGFLLLDEDILYEDGKYYPILKAVYAPKEAGEQALELYGTEDGDTLQKRAGEQYGPLLLKKAHPVLQQYLLWEQRHEEEIRARLQQEDGERCRQRLKTLQEREALRRYALSGIARA